MIDYLEDIDKCIAVLENGGLILYPTDTIWGIGCDATNATAIAKIYALKQRVETNKMIVLAATERDVMQYISQLDLEVFNYLKTVQKPTTVIYQGAIGVADNIISPDGSLAIRICQDEFCKHLLKRFKKPIVSTSANISGQPAPLFFKDITLPIISGVDYIVKYRQEDKIARESSTIIKWLNDGTPETIRL